MKELATRCHTVPASAIRAMVGKSYGMDNLISFAFGEPDFVTPRRIIDKGIEVLDAGRTFYTPNAGLPELREAVAASYEPRGMHYTIDNVIITVGGMEALLLTMLILLEEGDEVILSNPYWANYYGMVREFGAVPVLVDVREENGFMFDPAEIRSAVTPKTKAILINFPSNPTGGVATAENLKEIAKIAVENDLYVITDEMYRRLIYSDERFTSIAEFPGMKERCVIIDGFSKAYAMTGWRIGYAVANEEIISNMIKLQENAVSSVFEPVQRAALDALTGDQTPVEEMIAQYKIRRDLICDLINSTMDGKITCSVPEGTFYIFANIKGTGLTSEEFCSRLLEEEHVITVPGSGFGSNGEGFVRFSYATSEENIKEGLRRIKAFIDRIQG